MAEGVCKRRGIHGMSTWLPSNGIEGAKMNLMNWLAYQTTPPLAELGCNVWRAGQEFSRGLRLLESEFSW